MRAVSSAVVVPISTTVAIATTIPIPSAISVATIVTIAAITAAIMAVSTAVAAIARPWGARLELFVLLRDVDHQIFAQLLGFLNHIGVRASDVQVHGLLSFTAGRVLDITRALTLDLHSAASLLLDMLHIGTTVAYNLGAEIKSRNRLEGDGDLLLRPFALEILSVIVSEMQPAESTYSTIFVTLDSILLATAETALVDELREVLLHEFLDFLNCLFEALFCLTCYVEIQRRVLSRSISELCSIPL